MLELIIRDDTNTHQRALIVEDMGEAYATAKTWILPPDGIYPQDTVWTSATIWDRYTLIQHINAEDLAPRELAAA